MASSTPKRVASSIGALMKWLAIIAIHCMFIHSLPMPWAPMPAPTAGVVAAIHGNR